MTSIGQLSKADDAVVVLIILVNESCEGLSNPEKHRPLFFVVHEQQGLPGVTTAKCSSPQQCISCAIGSFVALSVYIAKIVLPLC